jgi:hypothetical protein
VVIIKQEEAKGKMLGSLCLIIVPFDSQLPELNDGGGREGTAIGIGVKYA